MYRVEDKFMCSEREMILLQSRMETVLRPDDNQINVNGYQVSSIYFDDFYDTHLQDAVDGNQWRQKYRIRIYNNSFETIKLEVKYKKYNRVRKISRMITYEQMAKLVQGKCITDDNPSEQNPITLFNLAVSEKGLRPKVIVAYERKAYVFDAGNVRITFDRNLRVGNQMESFIKGENVVYCPVTDTDRILEIKYDEFLPGFIAAMLETGNMNQVSYSKYRICREIKGGY